jgi:peptidoglycan/LPS O-acetylase OafA/YrhL
LGAAFDPRANGLNAVRLVLASLVIVHHAFPLSGREVADDAVRAALRDVPVDGFFAISGFLIVSSWVRRPQWWPYLRARALRILPGLYACLLVTAVVLAPLGLLLAGSAVPTGYVRDAAEFVLDGLNLRMGSYGIGETPTAAPFPGAWNGSLWTLFWEVLCYLGVLVAGVAGALRWRWSIPVVFALATLAAVLVDVGVIERDYWTGNGTRLGLMFAAGALVWFLQDRLPVGRWWGASGVVLLVGALVALPDYRTVAALPLAYLVMYVGAVLRAPRWRLRNDLSYGVYIYGFPVQQVVALAGGARFGVPVYVVLSLLGTLPLAAASWWCVEKPALRFKGRTRRPSTVQQAVTVDA